MYCLPYVPHASDFPLNNLFLKIFLDIGIVEFSLNSVVHSRSLLLLKE